MRNICITLLFIFFNFCVVSSEELNISGAWGWSSSNGDTVFMLNLVQNGNSLTGQHSCMSNRDSKIDASDDNTITGQKKGHGFDVVLNSSLAGTCNGRIDIIDQHTISWTVIKKSSGKDFIIPLKAVLKDTAE